MSHPTRYVIALPGFRKDICICNDCTAMSDELWDLAEAKQRSVSPGTDT